MTTLNQPINLELTIAEDVPAVESLWSRIFDKLGCLVGKPWSYLNEDMGPVDGEEDYYAIGGCCCL